MRNTTDVLRSIFLSTDSDMQDELIAEADKLRKAVQVLTEQITNVGYTKTEWEIKQFLLQCLPSSLTTEEIEKCYTPVAKCNFEVRVLNALNASKIELLGDLIQMNEKELIQIQNL